MSATSTHRPSVVPGALTVAVTSGKGGVGKTSTTVALAAALASRGVDVIVVDGDIDGPNVHLVADVADVSLGVDKQQLTLRLPASPHGFRVVTGQSITGPSATGAASRGQVTATDLIGMAQFADPAQVVLVDLPPGWTSHHETFCRALPDLVVAVVAPTVTGLADHARHVTAWTGRWQAEVQNIKSADKRRKVVLPTEPPLVAVETMARFRGIPEDGGDVVTVRRADAVPAAEVAAAAAPVVSIPATATVAEAAATTEIGVLAERVLSLLEDEAAVA